jgi:hypothetical protein
MRKKKFRSLWLYMNRVREEAVVCVQVKMMTTFLST